MPPKKKVTTQSSPPEVPEQPEAVEAEPSKDAVEVADDVSIQDEVPELIDDDDDEDDDGDVSVDSFGSDEYHDDERYDQLFGVIAASLQTGEGVPIADVLHDISAALHKQNAIAEGTNKVLFRIAKLLESRK